MPFFDSYDGTRLWYDELGDGEPLICVPGGAGGDGPCLGDLGGLAGDRALVRLDRRAAGRSEIPEDRASCAFTRQARDVEALRVHLGLERVDLLAQSAGTVLAQEYAAAHPDQMGKLVLVTPVGRVGREVDRMEVAAVRAAHAGQPWYDAAVEALRQQAEPGPRTAEQELALDRLAAPLLHGELTEAVL